MKTLEVSHVTDVERRESGVKACLDQPFQVHLALGPPGLEQGGRLLCPLHPGPRKSFL